MDCPCIDFTALEPRLWILRRESLDGWCIIGFRNSSRKKVLWQTKVRAQFLGYGVFYPFDIS